MAAKRRGCGGRTSNGETIANLGFEAKLSEPLRLMNERIALAQNQTTLLVALRDALLPMLLSGDVVVFRPSKLPEAIGP